MAIEIVEVKSGVLEHWYALATGANGEDWELFLRANMEPARFYGSNDLVLVDGVWEDEFPF